MENKVKNELAEEFIKNLKELPRGDIAILRRNAGFTIAESKGAAGIFYRILPPQLSGSRQEEIYFLVATLFGLNDKETSGDFGSTMSMVKKMSGSANIDRRMAILLDSEFELVDGYMPGGGELAYRMRQNVKLAKSKDLGVNWVQLIEDLCWWDHHEKRARKRWARSYFAHHIDESV